MMHHIILIGCSKKKSTSDSTKAVTPEQLYTSQLFQKRVEYAAFHKRTWYALSAKYGVWRPQVLLKPYDLTFSDMEPADRVAWHSGVCHHLVEELWEPFHQKQADGPIKPSELLVEIHAGADYCHPLAELLQALGIQVSLPMHGLQIGEQLAWYGKQVAA
jgi:hypothetical protein